MAARELPAPDPHHVLAWSDEDSGGLLKCHGIEISEHRRVVLNPDTARPCPVCGAMLKLVHVQYVTMELAP